MIEAAARQADVKIFPVFQNRFNRAIQRVRQALQSGELGPLRVLSVRVRWCRPQRYYDMSQWRGTFSQDGGALTNQGVHHVDLIRYLGGEVESLHSRMATLGANIEVEDTAVASFRFNSGALGNLEVTTSARPDDFEASISLVCEKGLAQIGGIAVNELQIFSVRPADQTAFSEDFKGNVYGNGHGVLYQNIQAHIINDIPYMIPMNDAFETLKLLHSFYASAETGQEVLLKRAQSSAQLGRADEKLSQLYRTPNFVPKRAIS